MELYSNSKGLFPTLRVYDVFPDTMIIMPGEYELAFPEEFEDAYMKEQEKINKGIEK